MIFRRKQVPEWASRATRRAAWRSALVVFVASEGRPIGALLLADELRLDTPRAIRLLREAGVTRIMMVTGDRAAAAQAIGAALDLDAVLSDWVPSDKVEAVRVEQRLHPTTMIGDVPHQDRVGQIRDYTAYLQELFPTKIRGMWVPERVWEQHLVSAIAEAGIEYTVLDDFHFQRAGVSVTTCSAITSPRTRAGSSRSSRARRPSAISMPFQEPHATYE